MRKASRRYRVGSSGAASLAPVVIVSGFEVEGCPRGLGKEARRREWSALIASRIYSEPSIFMFDNGTDIHNPSRGKFHTHSGNDLNRGGGGLVTFDALDKR
ncbi:hypothetical protein F4821DRAFT_265888 [Hypoxylon rubiginosum]|uniref:Uncharacterized protein n=1 Tax=Hypoxylon rubiginosum TaxID=110542 RepID=A0ACC0CJ67_9PEZI|nr:hypothetical protein F4821DRAFT_265888 [Hypoxylon rubiginosum]